jgi:hypothetical protein
MTKAMSSLMCLPEEPHFFVRCQLLTWRLSLSRERHHSISPPVYAGILAQSRVSDTSLLNLTCMA